MLGRNSLETSPEIVRTRMAELDAAIRVRRDEARIELPMRARLRLVFEGLGVVFDVPQADLEWEMWRESLWFIPELGVYDALIDVAHRELPSAVVTNNPFTGETVMRELRIHGLDAAIRFVASSADYGFRKPDPFLFRAAAGRLGVDPAGIWCIGSSADLDVVGARASGMKSVWYNPEGRPPPLGVEPDAEIKSWAEFPALLDRGI
jgi:putative hydrolase of the HAD superfamily